MEPKTHIQTVYCSDNKWSYMKNSHDNYSHCVENKNMYERTQNKRRNQNCVSMDVIKLEK